MREFKIASVFCPEDSESVEECTLEEVLTIEANDLTDLAQKIANKYHISFEMLESEFGVESWEDAIKLNSDWGDESNNELLEGVEYIMFTDPEQAVLIKEL